MIKMHPITISYDQQIISIPSTKRVYIFVVFFCKWFEHELLISRWFVSTLMFASIVINYFRKTMLFCIRILDWNFKLILAINMHRCVQPECIEMCLECIEMCYGNCMNIKKPLIDWSKKESIRSQSIPISIPILFWRLNKVKMFMHSIHHLRFNCV